MSTLPAGSITVRRLGRMGGYGGQDTFVCTTCGCVIASEYATRHIAWENTAKAATVVTADATVTTGPNPGSLPVGT